MSARNRKKAKPSTTTQRAEAPAAPSAGNRLDARPMHEQSTTSPTKFMALFFGIPAVVLIAAVAVKLLQAG